MADSLTRITGRGRLSEEDIEIARRERYSPHRTQFDYLHLAGILAALRDAFARLPIEDGPVLDLYCGTQPYREVIPWRPLWGVDVDGYFGRADVFAHGPLPFRNASASAAVITQALDVVFDPQATVAELRRVIRPGGFVVATVSRMFYRELPHQEGFDEPELRRLFSEWDELRIEPIGGPGAGWSLILGTAVDRAARRLRVPRAPLGLLALALNGVGALADRALGASRWPAGFRVVARRPAD